MANLGILTAGVAGLLLAGRATEAAVLVVLSLFIAIAAIAWTKRAIDRGRTADEILNGWLNFPVLGRFLRFGDSINRRLGYGSQQLLNERRGPPEDESGNP